jgi:hypothetical protein
VATEESKTRLFPFRGFRVLLLAACLVVTVDPLLALEGTTRATLTSEQIQSRITAVRESNDIDDTARTRAIELYQQAVANLETRRSNRETAEAYRQAGSTALEQMTAIRASMERRRNVDPVAALNITPTVVLKRLEENLESELANLSAIEAKFAIAEEDIENETQRPRQARERITAARLLMNEASRAAAAPSTAGQGPFLVEAARWSAETRIESLRSEIAMLDQELLTNGGRVELLQLQRDEMGQRVRRALLRIEALRTAVNAGRRDKAEEITAQATAVLEGSAGREPVLADLARANLSLVELLRRQVDEIDAVSVLERELRPLSTRLTEVYRSTRRRLELMDAGAPIGWAIREQRLQLPSMQEYRLKRNRIQRSITEISLRLIENEDEQRSLADLNASRGTNRRLGQHRTGAGAAHGVPGHGRNPAQAPHARHQQRQGRAAALAYPG